MPRPLKAEKDKLTELFTFRSTAEDYIEFQAAAYAMGMGMAPYFNQLRVEGVKRAMETYPERFERGLQISKEAMRLRSQGSDRQAPAPAARPKAAKIRASKARKR